MEESPNNPSSEPEPEFLLGNDQYNLEAATPTAPASPDQSTWEQKGSRPPELESLAAFKAKYAGMISDAEMPEAYRRALSKQLSRESSDRIAQRMQAKK